MKKMEKKVKSPGVLRLGALAEREIILNEQQIICCICWKELKTVNSYFYHLFKHHTKAELTLYILELFKLVVPKKRELTNINTSLEFNKGNGVSSPSPNLLPSGNIDKNSNSENLSSATNLIMSSQCHIYPHVIQSDSPTGTPLKCGGQVQEKTVGSCQTVEICRKSLLNSEASLETSAGNSNDLKPMDEEQVHFFKELGLAHSRSCQTVETSGKSLQNSDASMETSADNSNDLKPVDEDQIHFFKELGLAHCEASSKGERSGNESPANIDSPNVETTKKHLYTSKESTNFRVPVKYFAENPLPEHDLIFEPLLSPLLRILSQNNSDGTENSASLLNASPDPVTDRFATTGSNSSIFDTNLAKAALKKESETRGSLSESSVLTSWKRKSNHSTEVTPFSTTALSILSNASNNQKQKAEILSGSSKIGTSIENSTSNPVLPNSADSGDIVALNESQSALLLDPSSDILNDIKAGNQKLVVCKLCNTISLCCADQILCLLCQSAKAGNSCKTPPQSNNAEFRSTVTSKLLDFLLNCPENKKSSSSGPTLKPTSVAPRKTSNKQKKSSNRSKASLSTPKRKVSLEKNPPLVEDAIMKVQNNNFDKTVKDSIETSNCDVGNRIENSVESLESNGGNNPSGMQNAAPSVVSSQENTSSPCTGVNKDSESSRTQRISELGSGQEIREISQKGKTASGVNKYVRVKSNKELCYGSKADSASQSNENNEVRGMDGNQETLDNGCGSFDKSSISNENLPVCLFENFHSDSNTPVKCDSVLSAFPKESQETSNGKPAQILRPPNFVDSNGVVWGLVEIHNGNHPLRVFKPIKIPESGKAASSAQENADLSEVTPKKNRRKTPKQNSKRTKSETPAKKSKMKSTVGGSDVDCTVKLQSASINGNECVTSNKSEVTSSQITNPLSSDHSSTEGDQVNNSSSCLSNAQLGHINSINSDRNFTTDGLVGSTCIETSTGDIEEEIQSQTKSSHFELVAVPEAMVETVLSNPADSETNEKADLHLQCTCSASIDNSTYEIERNSVSVFNANSETCGIGVQCIHSSVYHGADCGHACHSNDHALFPSINENCNKLLEKRYLCGICCKDYSRKNHLVRHCRMHVNERPFECQTCLKRFTTKSILKQHERLHSGERPFACSFCDKTFAQKSSLLTHTMLHKGKSFKCYFCRFAVVSNHKLQRHLRRHEIGDSGLYCCACDVRFGLEGTFREHLSEVHNYPPEFKIGGSRLEQRAKQQRKIRSKQFLVTSE